VISVVPENFPEKLSKRNSQRDNRGPYVKVGGTPPPLVQNREANVERSLFVMSQKFPEKISKTLLCYTNTGIDYWAAHDTVMHTGIPI
jgi:hypothetical protein